ncbi:hypothetical protein WJX77_011587 [Trebouxia sp. C0004]
MVEAADAVELAVANPQRSVSQADVRPTCKVSPSQRGALFKVITEVGLSGATTKVLTEKMKAITSFFEFGFMPFLQQ